MLAAILGAILLRNRLASRGMKSTISEHEATIPGLGVIWAGEGMIRVGEGTIRADQGFCYHLIL